MDAGVFLAVLLAAFLHAVWNGFVKFSDDKFLGMSRVVIGHAPLSFLALYFAPPLNFECWPYLIAGAVLHVGYQVFLLNAYRLGDLSQVYPIARGIAPLIAMVISMAFLGVTFLPFEIAAILIIVSGIASLVLVRRADGLRNGKASLAAIGTGCFIAGYSLVDGLGARDGGSPFAFYGWLSMMNVVIWVFLMRFLKPGLLTRLVMDGHRRTLITGSLSFMAYAIVIWAFTQAPIATVMALRETSIIFALLIGVFVLKERLDLVKVISTFVTLAGAALLRISR